MASRSLASAATEEYEAWLAQNPLPSSQWPGTSAPATPPEAAAQQPPAHAATRFSWQDAPGVAARCLQHSGLRWSMQGRGTLVGSETEQAGSPVRVRLRLPRIVAGLHPALEQALQPSDSPLTGPASAEHDAVLAVLQSLAACEGGGGLRSSSSPGGLGDEGSSGDASWGSGGGPLQLGGQLLVLLSADSAALGLLREGELAAHKVLTGYTVRRKQGKAQLTYQREGGGARSVGGSIRARETRRLFQGAAAKLVEWAPDIAACNQLYRSGGVRVWNELYASQDPPPPVARGDARWREAGVGVRRPRLADLQRVAAALLHGELEELVPLK